MASRLPPGKYPRDRVFALATGPLVALIIVVGLVAFGAFLLAILAVMGGEPAYVVLDHYEHLWPWVRHVLIWIIAAVASASIPLILRKISQLGGIEAGVGKSEEHLSALCERLDAIEAAGRARDDVDRRRDRRQTRRDARLLKLVEQSLATRTGRMWAVPPAVATQAPTPAAPEPLATPVITQTNATALHEATSLPALTPLDSDYRDPAWDETPDDEPVPDLWGRLGPPGEGIKRFLAGETGTYPAEEIQRLAGKTRPFSTEEEQ